ncbi:hypothetical protein FACS189427_01350 [Planctomycetales bacterium]|nr:hypothetical protein FACS189427_01350 [Planctomycetales bacterium]
MPYRLIQLYSFTDDIILDPFMGSGTTAIAALKSERNYVGYDVSEEYITLANQRIQKATSQTALFVPVAKLKTDAKPDKTLSKLYTVAKSAG